MERDKFYELAESYKRVEKITPTKIQKPQDVFVNIPIVETPPQQNFGNQYEFSTSQLRKNNPISQNFVDDRIRLVGQIAEKTFLDQKRKELENEAEIQRKNERDAILIPHRLQKIKEQNILAQMRPNPIILASSSDKQFKEKIQEKLPTFYNPDQKIENNQFEEFTQKAYKPTYQINNNFPIEEKNSLSMKNPLDESDLGASKNLEKYLGGREGVPLTRDFVFQTKKQDKIEEENSKRLKNYINEKKIKERHYVPSNLASISAPNEDKIDKAKKERIAQECAKLVASAKLKLKKNMLDSAYLELQSAINNGTKHADVFYMFGEVNRLKGNFEQSVKFLTEALRFSLHSPYTYYSLGLSYSGLGEYEKSVKVLSHFLELIEIPDAHFELAKSLSKINENVYAVVHLTRAIELDPYNAIFYACRGEIYEAQGFLELAQKDYKKTLEVDHKFLEKYYKEVKEFENNGNYVMAAKINDFINKIINSQ